MKNQDEEKRKSLYTDLGIFLQMVLSVCTLIMGIFSLFEKELFLVCEIILVFLLFLLAYNNQKVYKRNFMTYGYAFVGFLLFMAVIWEILF